jgi:hypothetical protein
MTVVVLTVDQRASRTTPDLVPEALAGLSGLSLRLPFERTVGDEIQGVLDDPDVLPRAIELLLRADCWNIGLGVGDVDEPRPESARAGRGPAYLNARDAVTAAKNSPWHLRVVGDDRTGRDLESVLWLWAAVLDRRTEKGWEVTDLIDQGLSYDEAGQRLGISQSAVSQRAQAAGLVEGRRAREVVSHLAARLLGKEGP